MTYSICHHVEENILEVTFRGKLDIQIAKAALPDILNEVVRLQCRQLLTDLRKAEMSLSVAEIFNLPSLLEDLSTRLHFNVRLVRRAIVTHQPEQMQFYEDVFTNRGFSAAVFADPAQAKAWLCK